jgi:hypothetical protein
VTGSHVKLRVGRKRDYSTDPLRTLRAPGSSLATTSSGRHWRPASRAIDALPLSVENRWIPRCTGVACAVIALLLAVASPTVAGSRTGADRSLASTFPGRNGEIAVVRDHIVRYPNGRIYYGNGTGIFVVRPDGSDGHWLSGGRGHNPAWSPDGNKVLFVRLRGLWIVSSTSNQTPRPSDRGST